MTDKALSERLALFEEKIGYCFKNKNLLHEALSHSSYANECKKGRNSNERLEFLGDSVLSIVISEHLFNHFKHLPEGDLTKIRASLVCEKALFEFSKQISLGEFILLGKGEERFGGRSRDSILADAMESVIAACFLDGGPSAALGIVRRFILVKVPVTKLHNVDYKTQLQELVQQKKNQVLSYELVAESGPDHDKRFDVELSLNGTVVGTGFGTSKKRAEQAAARAAIDALFPGAAK